MDRDHCLEQRKKNAAKRTPDIRLPLSMLFVIYLCTVIDSCHIYFGSLM